MIHRLCYIEGPWAYFTILPLSEQWGDDWNDIPYEHNAGEPYSRSPDQIVRLVWEGPLDTPRAHHRNSPYSVKMINDGKMPWLRTNKWAHLDRHKAKNPVNIFAGVSIFEFIAQVKMAQGEIYTRMI